MKQLELVVAIDTMPAEVTSWADVVLPENTYLERYDDLHNPPFRVPLRRDPAAGGGVAVRHQARAGGSPRSSATGSASASTSAGRTPRTTSARSLSRRRVSRFERAHGDGRHHAPGARPIYDDSPQMTFKTPSKKIELYSKQLADAGLDPLPRLRAARRSRRPGYFRLLFGRSPGSHLLAHHQQPAAQRDLPGERAVDERRDGAAARASRTAIA